MNSPTDAKVALRRSRRRFHRLRAAVSRAHRSMNASPRSSVVLGCPVTRGECAAIRLRFGCRPHRPCTQRAVPGYVETEPRNAPNPSPSSVYAAKTCASLPRCLQRHLPPSPCRPGLAVTCMEWCAAGVSSTPPAGPDRDPPRPPARPGGRTAGAGAGAGVAVLPNNVPAMVPANQPAITSKCIMR
jgi:hypothetical protein